MTSTWIHLYLAGTPGYVLSSSFPDGAGDRATNPGAMLHCSHRGRPRVLVLDDEKIIADSISAILNRSGFDAVACYDGPSAIQLIQSECPDILLSDVVMPHMNGVQVAGIVRSHCPGTRIVLISGNAATPNLLEQASPDSGPFEVLAKPIHPTHLIQILRG